MTLAQQIQAVWDRTQLLQAQVSEAAIKSELIEAVLAGLYFVLEELQISEEELRRQKQALIAARQAVGRERQRYRTLFELAPSGYLVTDCDGKIQQANQAAAVLLGESMAALPGKLFSLYVGAEGRATVRQTLAQLTPRQDWEVTLVGQGPQPGKTVAIATNPITDPQGHPVAVLWSLRDITQQRQMQQQLQAAHDHLEQRVQARTADLAQANDQLQREIAERIQVERTLQEHAALLEIAPDAIFVQDLQARITYWNQGAEQVYGWSRSEAIGKTSQELLGSTALPAEAILSPANASWQGELTHSTKSGQPLILLSRRTLIFDADEVPQAVLVVNTDITEKKQLETQFYRSQRLESLGTLVSGITHDLNNALAPVITATDLLAASPALDASALELLDIIKTSASHSASLIQRTLVFARGGQNERVAISVRRSLSEVIQLLQQTIPKTIAVQADMPSHLSDSVSASPTQLHQVWMNLCINACDAMPQGGTLTLTVSTRRLDAIAAQSHIDARPGDYVVVTVSDTGSGIDPSLMDRIFDPFFTTKASDEGTGLGLSTAYRLVQDHGGFMQVSSQLGQGTRFEVYLPAVPAHVLRSPAVARAPLGQGETILVVDDDRNVQRTMQFLLEAAGYQSQLAGSGSEAIRLYQQCGDAIAAVLLDLNMPGLDGVATLQCLQQIHPDIPIIVMSGLPQPQVPTDAIAVLPKPSPPQELLATLRQVLVKQPQLLEN